jgi:hypothetical protein
MEGSRAKHYFITQLGLPRAPETLMNQPIAPAKSGSAPLEDGLAALQEGRHGLLAVLGLQAAHEIARLDVERDLRNVVRRRVDVLFQVR